MREGAQVGCGCVVADPEVTRLETTSGLPANRPRRGKASGPGASSGPSPAVGHGIPVAMPTFQYQSPARRVSWRFSARRGLRGRADIRKHLHCRRVGTHGASLVGAIGYECAGTVRDNRLGLRGGVLPAAPERL
jgi:hypothetical protein